MNQQDNKLIGRWLLLGVIMLTIQVLLGGITRLTGSGLSITEWKPIIGLIPPLNEEAWQVAFEKYQSIAQYKVLNTDFSLADFKFIFFWEWFHRNWAHFIGFAFIFPFIYFIAKKKFNKEIVPKLAGLFILGVGQGFIGKIMVESGLNDEDIYVSHIRLAIHFISALILIVFTYWFALGKLVDEKDKIYNPAFKGFTWGTIALLGLQLVYGAFMAGLKAATVAPTWPSINGDYLPAAVYNQSWINHPINIHFIHRGLAYIILLLILIWTWRASKLGASSSLLFRKYQFVPLLFVSVQVVLGIFAVLLSTKLARNSFGPFEWMAQLHQLIAMFLLMSLVWAAFIFSKGK
ncbi:MAG: COX15/CtaA family protein [Chitinophagaceae bacterium]|nr:COX15/CtaA family protein [Chitinophagaceae bacterium]